MPSGKAQRRRGGSSCTQCYSRKQKCNHQYPCNHCTRRRVPELCSYKWPGICSDDSGSAASVGDHSPSPVSMASTIGVGIEASTALTSEYHPPFYQPEPYSHQSEVGFSACFGYFDGSVSNLLALMKEYQMLEDNELQRSSHNMITETTALQILAQVRLLPERPILHCLIQNFFKEVNWIHGIIYPPAFLSKYESWWRLFSPYRIHEIEFGVLLLRICAYSAQFLPYLTYNADTQNSISIHVIRERCNGLAAGLTKLAEMAGGLQSFTGLQTSCLNIVYLKSEGRIEEAWLLLGRVISNAYNMGLHLPAVEHRSVQLNEVEKEMRKRVWCNLFVWDRHWSLVLDRIPHIHDRYGDVPLPKMRLGSDSDDLSAPDPFLERILQAQLVKLWYSITSQPREDKTTAYDPVAVEEGELQISREFVSKLPPVFDLNTPDGHLDGKYPVLVRQRQLLRISYFTLLCHIYRPILLLDESRIDQIPSYKRYLLPRHRASFENAATSLLDSVERLHDAMGGGQTRYFLISFYTFEPAMLLIMHLLNMASSSICTVFGAGSNKGRHTSKALEITQTSSPIDGQTVSSSDLKCRLYINKALRKLNLLREASPIAALGARKILQLVARLDLMKPFTGPVAEQEGTQVSLASSIHNSIESGIPELDFQNFQSPALDLEVAAWPFDEYGAGSSQIIDAVNPGLFWQ